MSVSARRIGELAVSRVVAALLSAALFVLAGRHLSVPEFGDFALLLALGAMITAIHDFGYPLIISDHVKRSPGTTDVAVRQVLWRRLGLAAAGAVVTALLYVPIAAEPSLVVPAVFSLSLLATAWYTTATAALRSLEAVRSEALAEIGSRVVVLAVGAAVLFSGGGVQGLVSVYALADVVAAVYLWEALRARLPAQEGGPPAGFQSLRRAAPLAAVGVVGMFYYRIDTWLVGLLDDPAGVATYASAYRILDGVLLVSGAAAVMVLPTTSGLEPSVAVRQIRRLAVMAACVVAVPASVVFATAPAVMASLFGSDYRHAAGVLRILMLTAVPATVVTVCAPRLALLQRERLAARLVGYLMLNIMLNLLLIPPVGPSGAAWATLFCQTALSIDLWRRLKKP